MKKILLLVVCALLPARALTQSYAFEVAIMNLEQTDETTIEWDIYIRKAPGSEDFALYTMAVDLAFNNAILNTGDFNSDDFTITPGPGTNQHELFFLDRDCTVSGTPPNRQLHWTVSLPPKEGETMTIVSGNWLQLARFRLQLTKDGNPHNFACANAALTFLPGDKLPTLYRALNTALTYDGQGSTVVPLHATSPEAGVAASGKQLSGYCFSGTGNWNDSQHWNTTTTANANTIPDQPTQNATITGSATIAHTIHANQLYIQPKQVILPSVTTGQLNTEYLASHHYFIVEYNEVVSSGDAPIIERGVIVGNSPNVNFAEYTNYFTSSGAIGQYVIYEVSSHGVMEGDYFRAFATSGVGTAYGQAYRVSDLAEGEGPIGGLTNVPVRLTIAPTGSLTANALHNELGADALVLQSSESGTASLIHGDTEAEGTVQRYIPASTGWPGKSPDPSNWYWVSPPMGQQNISEYLNALGPGEDYDLYRWDETADTWINHKGTNFERQYFQRGEGYLFAAQADATFTYTGQLHTGSQTWEGLSRGNTTAEHGPGWHLIGNPYASGLQYNSNDWSSSTVSYTPQYWVESEGSYSAWTEGQVIPPSTAFFVEALSGNASLTIDQAAQAHPTTAIKSLPGKESTASKESSANKENRVSKESDARSEYIILAAMPCLDCNLSKLAGSKNEVGLKEHLSGSTTLQRSYIRLAPDLADGFDNRYHSRFRPGDAPWFFSVSNGNSLLVNAVRSPDPAMTIPFYFKKNNESNTFLIKLERSITATPVYLTDLKENKKHLLTPTQPYVFQSASTDDPMRFVVGFGDTVHTDLEPLQTPDNQVWTHGGELHLLLNDNDIRMVLYDTRGREMWHGRARAGQHVFNPELLAGVYLLKMTGQNQVHTHKIILK